MIEKRCIECLSKSFNRVISEKINNDIYKGALKKSYEKYLGTIQHAAILTPEVAREIHAIITRALNNSDPYHDEKKISNAIALHHYSSLKKCIAHSKDKFDTAMRLSIAGNIMDFAACPEFFEDSNNYFNATIEKVQHADMAINHSKALHEQITTSKTVLFLGDNAGEIVLDKLFLETIAHPNVYYAVRDKPILNDATMEDANYVKMHEVAKVISNGYDAPSTLLANVSEEFLRIWEKADVIISKGQGNYEGLLDNKRENLFFLLMVKCDVIAEKLNVQKGEFLVRKNGSN